MTMSMPTVDDLDQFAELFEPNNGIFLRIANNWGWVLPEWIGVNNRTLDEMCWTQFGYRKISLTLHRYLEKFPDDEAWLDKFSDAIYAQFHKKWDKILDAANTEYDPIHNFYDHIDEFITDTQDERTTNDIDKTSIRLETRDLTVSRLTVNSGQKNNSGTVTDQRTDNLTERTDRDITVDFDDHNQNNLYGFNSQDVVGDSTSGEQSETHTVDGQSKVNTGTQTNVRTDATGQTTSDNGSMTQTDGGTVNTSDTQTDDRTEVRDFDGTRERHLIRSGNIGNLTTQSLLEQEFNLWKYNFVQEMIDDVKNYSTLPIYVD